MGITHGIPPWSAVCGSRRSRRRFTPQAEAGGCASLEPVTHVVEPPSLRHSGRFLLWRDVPLISASRDPQDRQTPFPPTGSQSFKSHYGAVRLVQMGCKVTSKKPQVCVLPGEMLLLLPVPENLWHRQVKAACQGGSGFAHEWVGKGFILSPFCCSEMPKLQVSSSLLLLQGTAKGETCA